MPNSTIAGPLLIFAAALLWAADGVLRRFLFDLPPVTIVFLEHVIGLIVISPFLIRAWKGEKLAPKEWGVIGVVSLLSGVLGTLFFTTALLEVNFIPFSVVFLLQKLQPIFAVLMAWFVLKEKVTPKYLMLAAIALVAGYFVTFPQGVINFGAEGAYVTAALFAFLAAVAWGSSTAFSRSLLLNHSQTFITGLRFLLTIPIAFVFMLGMSALPSLGAVTADHLMILLAIAVSTGLAALWIYYQGLKYTRVAVATIVELAFPVTAVFIDFFLYQTTLHWSQYLAAAVLLFVMYRIALLNRKTELANS